MPRKASADPSSLPARSEGGDNVAALERGFRVLDCFAHARRPLGNSEVAALTGIPRPSVTRLIATLVTLGHLRPVSGSERWEMAAGVVRLAEAFLGALDIRSFARPHLVRLAEELGVSSFLGVRDGIEVLVVEASRARSAVAVIGADVGTRMSLATSALGRGWLAGVDEPMRQAVREQLRHAGASRAELAQLDRALLDAREAGYTVSLGDWNPNVNAIAVPVRTPGGEVVSINCGGPGFVLSSERLMTAVVPRLLAAAAALARDIGGQAGPELTNPPAPSEPKAEGRAQAAASSRTRSTPASGTAAAPPRPRPRRPLSATE